jgi:hypothetical protein
LRVPLPTEKRLDKSDVTDRCALEVSDIFREHGAYYRANHSLSAKQHSVMFDIEHCRTSEFGYHVDVCDACGYVEGSHNSCRNRHCPKCQGIARRIWVKARLQDLLPILYYHVVFTLPHKIFPVSLYNKELIYTLLFECAAKTLLQFGRDPKHLGALIGFYGILHTWGGKLWQHLHLHFIVTGGGLSDRGQWVEPKYKGKFLFPVCAVSQVFRGKFIEGLKAAYYSGQLILPEGYKHLEDAQHFEGWLDELVARNWVVYTKPPFETPEKVVRYIGRYTHKVAISNNRLISLDNGYVQFRYRDYREKGRWKEAALSAEEFIQRFLMHVLPVGFHRIRHYGLLANGRCKAKVEQIRQLLLAADNESDEPPQDCEDCKGKRCPACEKGILKTLLIVNRFGRVVRSLCRLTMMAKTAWDTS